MGLQESPQVCLIFVFPSLLHLQKESLEKFQGCIGFESCVYNCDNLLSYNYSPRSSHI